MPTLWCTDFVNKNTNWECSYRFWRFNSSSNIRLHLVKIMAQSSSAPVLMIQTISGPVLIFQSRSGPVLFFQSDSGSFLAVQSSSAPVLMVQTISGAVLIVQSSSVSVLSFSVRFRFFPRGSVQFSFPHRPFLKDEFKCYPLISFRALKWTFLSKFYWNYLSFPSETHGQPHFDFEVTSYQCVPCLQVLCLMQAYLPCCELPCSFTVLHLHVLQVCVCVWMYVTIVIM
jgi:hypothetical protein